MTEKQWDDVADLCEQAASGFEIGYEDHDHAARKKAAEWCRSLSMKAARNSFMKKRKIDYSEEVF